MSNQIVGLRVQDLRTLAAASIYARIDPSSGTTFQRMGQAIREADLLISLVEETTKLNEFEPASWESQPAAVYIPR